MSRRVLVTRAAEGASSLAAELRRVGLEPVVVPVIAIAPPESYGDLDGALGVLESIDWLIFSSANGVGAFLSRCRETGMEPGQWPATLRVAVIGKATARAAESAGIPVSLTPQQAVAESLAAALEPFAKKTEGQPARMLLLRAAEGRDVLPERLRAAGAEVQVVAAYRNVIPEDAVEQMQTVLGTGAVCPAAVTFTSASTVRNLLALCSAAGVPLPGGMLRVSIGPVTSEALRSVGLPPHVEAPEASVASLAQVVADVVNGARG